MRGFLFVHMAAKVVAQFHRHQDCRVFHKVDVPQDLYLGSFAAAGNGLRSNVSAAA